MSSKTKFTLLSFMAVIVSFIALSACAAAGAHKEMQKTMRISENLFLSKGGIGIINTDLYVDLNSKFNELILANGERWRGLRPELRQTVYVCNKKALGSLGDDVGCSLDKSIVISFEGEKVYFFDFDLGEGGFYLRELPEDANRP